MLRNKRNLGLDGNIPWWLPFWKSNKFSRFSVIQITPRILSLNKHVSKKSLLSVPKKTIRLYAWSRRWDEKNFMPTAQWIQNFWDQNHAREKFVTVHLWFNILFFCFFLICEGLDFMKRRQWERSHHNLFRGWNAKINVQPTYTVVSLWMNTSSSPYC